MRGPVPLDELYPPAQYSGGWLMLALGIILVAIALGYLLRTLTKPIRLEDLRTDADDIPSADVLAALKTEYFAQIDDIQRRHDAGRLSGHEANRELSSTVRRFVNEYSGLEAPVLSLADLRALDVHPALVDALHRHYYPSIFRRAHVVDPAAGADAARRVVQLWH